MVCAKTDGSTPEVCSRLAADLFPLSLWRNVTADAARAAFGTIFFIVEITKGYASDYAHLTTGIFGVL
jgi:hypothetical protein